MPRITDHGYGLCARCATLLERRLGDLPAQHDALRHLLLEGMPPGERLGNSATKGSPPLPSRGFDVVHDHLTLMQQQLVSWVELVKEERSLRGPDTPTVTVLAAWLLSQIDWLLGHGAVGDLAHEVRELARTAEGLTRTQPRRHRSPVPCRECKATELHRLDGDDHWLCTSCGLTFHQREYDEHTLTLAENSTVTAPEAAELLGVPRGTFRRWATTGVIQAAGQDSAGRHRYRLDHVEALKREAS